MKTCLITGASGFVGRHLAAALQQSPDPWLLRLVARDTDRLQDREGVTRHVVSTIDGNTEWPSLQGTDVVVHAAARVHVMQDPASDVAWAQYQRVNTDGTLRLAQRAADAGVQRFIFLSTIGVHGAGQERPYNESDNPVPNSPYAQSKLDAEIGLRSLAARSGMEVVVIRPPLVYGPGAPGNFARLAAMVQRGIPLPLGSVRNLRSLIAIDNLVSFIQCCMTHPAAANQTFLVSDGQDLSTPDLISGMGAALNRPVHLLPCPPTLLLWGMACLGKKTMHRQLTSTLRADIRKARTLLNWVPPIPVSTALIKALSPHQPR